MSHRIVAGAVCFCLAVAATGGARSTATVQLGATANRQRRYRRPGFDAATNAPIRRAQIHGSNNELFVDAVSDDEGRFQLNDLPAGQWRVTVAKGGYFTWQIGQRTPVRPTRTDRTRPRATGEGDVGLSRGGVIAGRV